MILRRLPTIDSTQDEARRLVEAGAVKAGTILVADEQTAGRGRFGRSWLSPRGGLYASFIVGARREIAMIAGVAALAGLSEIGVTASLKWPNDVVVEDGKLGGILVETIGKRALVGIGINVQDAPLPGAVSLRQLGVPLRRGDLVVAIGRSLERLEPTDALRVYRRRLITLGRAVRIQLENGEAVEGTACDIDSEGRLLIDTASGIHVVSSGECAHLELPTGGDLPGSPVC